VRTIITGVIGLFGLILGIAGAYWLLRVPDAPPESGGMLLQTEPALVTQLRVESAGRQGTLDRAGSGETAAWTLHWRETDADAFNWRARPDRVRAALRILSTTPWEAGGTGEPDSAFPRVTIRSADPESGEPRERVLVFDPASLGGRSRVWVDGSPGVVASEVAHAMGVQPWTAWLDNRLLPTAPAMDAAGAQASRLSLEAATGAGMQRLELRRGPRGWAITEPVRAPADSERVTALVRALRALEWSRPAGELSEREAGLDRPSAVLSIADAGGRAQRAIVGGAVPGRGTVFVRLESGAGEATLLVEAPRDGLERIALDPGMYASRRATEVGSGDVRMIGLRWSSEPPDTSRPAGEGADRLLRRTIEGWRLGQDDAPADAGARGAADLLVRLLTEMEADRVSVTPPDGAGHAAWVTLAGADGLPIAHAGLYVREGAVHLRTGDLWRRYDGTGLVTLIAWIGEARQSDGAE